MYAAQTSLAPIMLTTIVAASKRIVLRVKTTLRKWRRKWCRTRVEKCPEAASEARVATHESGAGPVANGPLNDSKEEPGRDDEVQIGTDPQVRRKSRDKV